MVLILKTANSRKSSSQIRVVIGLVSRTPGSLGFMAMWVNASQSRYGAFPAAICLSYLIRQMTLIASDAE
jgi:hypothetical protein